MYSLLIENNYSSELKDMAQKFIIEDREKFIDIHKCILDYSREHKILISNIDFLLDRHKYWENILLYASDTHNLAVGLMKKLCKDQGKRFFLRINERDIEYTIMCETRNICMLSTLETYDKISINELISPIKYEQNYIFPPIVEVISLYNMLYNPNISEDWEDTYSDIKMIEKKYVIPIIEEFISKDEEYLIKLFTTSVNNLHNDKRARKTKEFKKQKKTAEAPCDQIKMDEINHIKELVMEFLSDSKYLLVGKINYLLDTCQDKLCINSIEYIEIISDGDIDNDLKSLIDFLSKHINYGISVKEKKIYIPKESMMKKNIIYLEYKQNNKVVQKPLIHIYNNLEYELINYYAVKKNNMVYKLADPITQTRFLYINIWQSMISQRIHGLNYAEFQNHIINIAEIIYFYKKKIDIYEIKKNYLGKYLDKIIQKKLNIGNLKEKNSFYCHDIDTIN